MKKTFARSSNIFEFWQSVCIAGAQVTFGICAALWFVPPFDFSRQIILIINAFATGFFLIAGYNVSRNV